MPSVLFLPSLFADGRIWGDLPSRLMGAHHVTVYDRTQTAAIDAPITHALVPDPTFRETVRAAAPEGTKRFDVVVGADEAAVLAVDLAFTGLAKGIVLFSPTVDTLPPEIEIDLAGAEELAETFRPLLQTLDEPDPERRRDLVVQICRNHLGSRLSPDDLELICTMQGDHAEEMVNALKISLDSLSDTPSPPPEGWWIDRLQNLPVPITIVVPEDSPAEELGISLAARAPRGSTALIHGADFPWLQDRERALDIVLNMINKVG